MNIVIEKVVTGYMEETYIAKYSVVANVRVKFETEDGKDIRDVDPSAADFMVKESNRKAKEAIKEQVIKDAIDELVKEAENDTVVTHLVEKILLIVHPDEHAKMLRAKTKEKRKKPEAPKEVIK